MQIISFHILMSMLTNQNQMVEFFNALPWNELFSQELLIYLILVVNLVEGCELSLFYSYSRSNLSIIEINLMRKFGANKIYHNEKLSKVRSLIENIRLAYWWFCVTNTFETKHPIQIDKLIFLSQKPTSI